MTTPLQLSIGLCPPDAAGESRESCLHLDLGPQHPSRTGLLLASARVSAGLLEQVRIQPGFNHRSAEKLFEVRDYRQVLVLADRHDWQAPFTGELVVALACEHLMGLVPPSRATWLRTLLAEHARISSHLAHLSFVPHRLGADDLGHRVRTTREHGRKLLLAVSGNRVHPMLNRLGGLALDIDSDAVAQFAAWAQSAAALAVEVDAALRNSQLGAGVGVLDADQVQQFGLGGPAAIAAGLAIDLRVVGDYLAYPELSDELVLELDGVDADALGRMRVLCAQIGQSASVMATCRGRLAELPGPVDTKLSKIVKVPEAEGWLAVEAPWGPAGVWLVSRAERTPWRLALRTPSFANVQALQVALEGCPVAEADAVVASLGWTSGDLDK